MPEPRTARPAIHVVAGVLVEGGRVCITRRRRNVHQGGRWEFPGGKLEPGEEPLVGLKRELGEELGITVEHAVPFMRVRHGYAELDVLLDVWRLTRYQGTPHGREAQAMRWVSVSDLDAREFPDADRAVLRRLQLPALYLLSDVGRFGRDGFSRRLARALEAGVRLVQFREPTLDRTSFVSYARELAALCRQSGARFLVNADPGWAVECAADGVHLNSQRLLALSERPLAPEFWVGASCHDETELQKAQALELDFVVLGPVQPTASHPGGAVLGWERFGELRASSALPVYAIGGMTSADLAMARAVGAQGLAMISGVWGQEDFESVVRAMA